MEWHGLLSVCLSVSLLFTLSFFFSFFNLFFLFRYFLRWSFECRSETWMGMGYAHTHTHTTHAGRQTKQTNKQIAPYTNAICTGMGSRWAWLVPCSWYIVFHSSSFSFRVCFCFPIALLFYCIAFAFSCFPSPLAQTIEGMDSGSVDCGYIFMDTEGNLGGGNRKYWSIGHWTIGQHIDIGCCLVRWVGLCWESVGTGLNWVGMG